MAGERTISVTIRRYDPERGESRLQTYQVSVRTGEVSVMNVLDRIAEEIDPSLAWYGPCRTGKCGGGFMAINGKPGFACAAVVESDLVLEPAPGRAVLADLVTE